MVAGMIIQLMIFSFSSIIRVIILLVWFIRENLLWNHIIINVQENRHWNIFFLLSLLFVVLVWMSSCKKSNHGLYLKVYLQGRWIFFYLLSLLSFLLYWFFFVTNKHQIVNQDFEKEAEAALLLNSSTEYMVKKSAL